MANNYKNVMTTLTATTAATVYTVPNDKISIVKTMSAYNSSTGNTDLTVQLTDSSATATITWDKETVATLTRKAFLTNGEVLVLDEADVVKMTASVANKFHIFMSVLETD